MSEQQQVSRQDYFFAQQLESLARQNTNLAIKISQLEAELLTIRAEQQSADQMPGSDEPGELADKVIETIDDPTAH